MTIIALIAYTHEEAQINLNCMEVYLTIMILSRRNTWNIEQNI